MSIWGVAAVAVAGGGQAVGARALSAKKVRAELLIAESWPGIICLRFSAVCPGPLWSVLE
jgi:hypothetical protein